MENPSAFPQPIHKVNFDTTPRDFIETGCGGMSLRDWFAGMALQGIKSNIELCRICSNVEGMTQPEATSKMAFTDADAMLAERSKP